MVYSSSELNVTLRRSRMSICTCNENSAVLYNYAILPTTVKLPLFGQEVRTSGFHCTISFTVNKNYDFGYYMIGVSNAVGEISQETEIVPKGDFQFCL